MKRTGSWFMAIAVGIALCILMLHRVWAVPDENTNRFAASEPGEKPLPAFHAELLKIAREYRNWRPLDTASRWAPTLCRAPLPSDLRNVELRLSASDDADTHGHKLYLLYARDPAAYRRAPNHPAAVGQVIVKEAWKAVRVTEADKTAEGWKAIRQTLTDRRYPTSCTIEVKGQSVTVPVRFLATKGDVQYRPSDLDSLFIMFKTDEKRDGTDNGWVYGTVTADGKQVTAAGRIDQCMTCHREAGQDRLFGVKTFGFPQVPVEQTSDAIVALAPGTVKKLKAKAPEVLQVELVKVQKGAAKGENQDVTYTARIFKVGRSKSGLTAGDTIEIQSYIRNPNHKALPMPGPIAPSLHAKGWKGKVFLRTTANAKELEIAVFGHSFE